MVEFAEEHAEEHVVEADVTQAAAEYGSPRRAGFAHGPQAAPSAQPPPVDGLGHHFGAVRLHASEHSVWSALGTTPAAATISEPHDPDELAVRDRAEPVRLPARPVRLHTGLGAERAAHAVRAAAFTVGSDIVLGAAARSGARAPGIVAHELAHAARNGGAPTPDHARIQRAPETPEPARAADPVEPSPVVSALPADSRQVLTAAGIALDPEDEAALAQLFPNGFTLQHQPDFVLDLWFGTALQAFRLDAVRVVPVPPLMPASEVWIPKIGKGRSILISSTGGKNSVLLDAGAGTSRSPTAPRVQRLVETLGLITAGPASVPVAIGRSHNDADHDNAIRRLLARPEFSKTAVEVAVEQVRGAAAGNWSSLSLTVQPDQRVIEIAVASGQAPGSVIGPPGAEVHQRVQVLDGFTLIEFRSVQAHRDLTDADRATYNRNRTSPVTIVIDHRTAERRIFTGDGEGRQFSEVIDAIGEGAARRLFGGGGANLRSLEPPHHYGEQSGVDARGFLRLLRMSYEASAGSVSLLAQTSTKFAGGDYSVVKFLDDANIPSTQVTTDPSARGAAEVVRQRGAATEVVTLDAGGIRSVLSQAAAQETVLQAGHRRAYELERLQGRLQSMSEALEASGGFSELRASVRTMLTDTEQARTATAARLEAVWGALGAAAEAKGGVRAGADMSGVRTEGERLRVFLEVDPVQQTQRNLDAHEGALTAYGRLFVNVSRMLDAYANERIQELRELRAEHTRLVRAARGVLGNATVDAHVKAAWNAARQQLIEQRAEVMASQGSQMIAARKLNPAFRAQLATTLGRQMQLNETMQLAMHGQLPSARTGGVRFRTWAGNFFLLAIEVSRLGLELYESIHAANLATTAWESKLRVQGTESLAWLSRRGVQPELALFERDSWSGWNEVSSGMSQDAIRNAAVAETPPPGTPSFTMVAVTGIAEADLRRLVVTMSMGGISVAGWMRENGSFPDGPLFKQIDGVWGVRLWHRGGAPFFSLDPGTPGMRWVRVDDLAPGLGAELTDLQQERAAAQDADLADDVAAAGPGALRTVKNADWIGATREVWVYRSSGAPRLVDFGEQQPRFLVQSETDTAYLIRGKLALVRAADSATFQRLADTYWIWETGTSSIGADGRITRDRVARPNLDGFALVPIDDLEPL